MEIEEKKVSVIIPTYNRAHIIAKTIPSYLQKNVGEIIVIDDASTDRTQEVLAKLKKRFPQLKILRNKQNRKQTYSKNRGVKQVQYPYVYFGDDDSFITEGTIATLLKYVEERPNSLIGARPLYLGEERQIRYLTQYIHSTEKFNADDGYQFFNFNNMISNTGVYYSKLTKVNILPACFIIPTKYACKLKFDNQYRLSNAFREESDYVMQAREIGLNCYYAPEAYQINYPRNRVNEKDIRAGILYEYGCYKNTKYFLDKHYSFLKAHNIVCCSKKKILLNYIFKTISKYIFEKRVL